ncbi:NADH dehydrogenase subunit L [Ignicoccus pacificus DSM 13166]|uniref:NADH dehydrogenase subunit L n=1 Tax=Ignicoccus pacificus DSM 13166 TaxID=940294 RepID=A0A977K8U2_9CREN|nr:NADH dehydrogenase subunit L [Ignicoccus pacificus DSM 13166]
MYTKVEATVHPVQPTHAVQPAPMELAIASLVPIAIPLIMSIVVLTSPLYKKFKYKPSWAGNRDDWWEWSLAVITGGIVVLSSFVLVSYGFGHSYLAKFYDWYPLPGSDNYFALYIDTISSVMALVVSIITFLDLVYSWEYMAGARGPNRYYSEMLLFLAAMEGIVLSANIILILLFWELVGAASFLLISYYWYDPKIGPNAVRAGRKAILVTRIADLFFLAGVGALVALAGTGNFLHLANDVYLIHNKWLGAVALTAILFGITIGALGKSAQIPFWPWLSDAMEGPTTVSAVLHSATMVAAGAYLIARLFPLYDMYIMYNLTLMDFIAVIGAITAFVAGLFGAAARDIKKVIAFSTMSQLGYMFSALGLGSLLAGAAHLYIHAFFKALLFLGAGAVIHSLEHILHDPYEARDMFNMGGLWKYMKITFVTTLIALLSLVGIPPFAGWWSKELIIESAVTSPVPHALIAGVLLTLAAGLTGFYSGRLLYLTFFGRERWKEKHPEAHVHEAGPAMRFALVAMALIVLISGPTIVLNLEQVIHVTHEVHRELPISLGNTALTLAIIGFLLPIAYYGTLGVAERRGILHKLWYPFYKEFWFHEFFHGIARFWIRAVAGFTDMVEKAYTKFLVTTAFAIGRTYAWVWALSVRLADEEYWDVKVIDGFGRLTARLGRALWRLQSGDINLYLALAVAGFAVLMFITLILVVGVGW